jgi:hypothetical protein
LDAFDLDELDQDIPSTAPAKKPKLQATNAQEAKYLCRSWSRTSRALHRLSCYRELASGDVALKVADNSASLIQDSLAEYSHRIGQCVHADLKASNLATEGFARTQKTFMPRAFFDKAYRPYLAKFTAFPPSRQGQKVYGVLNDMKALHAIIDPGFLTASFGSAGADSITSAVVCEESRPFRVVYCLQSNMLHCEHVYEAKLEDGRFCVQAKQRLRQPKAKQQPVGDIGIMRGIMKPDIFRKSK